MLSLRMPLPMLALALALGAARATDGGGGDVTRCGWSERYEMCLADWGSICESLTGRVAAGEFGEESGELADALTVRWLVDYCARTRKCGEVTEAEKCGDMARCNWLENGDARKSRCVGDAYPQEWRGAGRLALQEHGGAREFEQSFLVQLDRILRECGQIGLQNEDICQRYGKPCMWTHVNNEYGSQSCRAEMGDLVEELAPRLSEFMMVDQYCTVNFFTADKCLKASEVDLALRDFQLIPEGNTYAKLAGMLTSATLVVLVAMCCRPNPPKRRGSTGRLKRRSIQMISED